MTYLNFNNLLSIIEIINKGNVVALPTDTIFGLVAKMSEEQAINKIYKIKNRATNKPLAILVTSWEQAKEIGIISSELIQYLNTNFLSRTVTVIVKKQPNINQIAYWKKWDTVAMRVTESPMIKKIIEKIGPLVATSCNVSGQPPINDSEKINLQQLEYIVEGKIISGKASTVYDSINDKILRKQA